MCPAPQSGVLRALLGVRDLRADLHQNMTTSLRRIAGIAERQAPHQAQVAHQADAADRD